MKKKIIILIVILVLLILLFPIKKISKDGGSREYTALIYTVSRVHRYVPENETNEYVKPYEDGWVVKILNFEIYNKVK